MILFDILPLELPTMQLLALFREVDAASKCSAQIKFNVCISILITWQYEYCASTIIKVTFLLEYSVRSVKDFFESSFHNNLHCTAAGSGWLSLEDNVMQLCECFKLRMFFIISGSAKLQLVFNWLLWWVNNEYLPVVLCSVMKKQ